MNMDQHKNPCFEQVAENEDDDVLSDSEVEGVTCESYKQIISPLVLPGQKNWMAVLLKSPEAVVPYKPHLGYHMRLSQLE